MAGRERTVYFFSLAEVNVETEELTTWSSEALDALWEHIAELDLQDRRVELRNRDYEGELRVVKDPAVDVLYIGKLRPGSDWPDVRRRSSGNAALGDDEDIEALIEPAYVVRVWNTDYVAVLRTSGGPTTTAVADWLSSAAGLGDETGFQLRPYVREDQLERLQHAQGASRLHLKVDRDVLDDAQPKSQIGRAFKEMQDAADGAVSVEAIISFGHAYPDGPGGEAVAAAVKDYIGKVPLKKAELTALIPTAEGLKKDTIDFVSDRVTYTQLIGGDEHSQPTMREVALAMSAAIARFKDEI